MESAVLLSRELARLRQCYSVASSELKSLSAVKESVLLFGNSHPLLADDQLS